MSKSWVFDPVLAEKAGDPRGASRQLWHRNQPLICGILIYPTCYRNVNSRGCIDGPNVDHSMGWPIPRSPLVRTQSMSEKNERVTFDNSWLVVEPPLWKIWVSQLGLLFPKYGSKKNVPSHQPDTEPTAHWFPFKAPSGWKIFEPGCAFGLEAACSGASTAIHQHPPSDDAILSGHHPTCIECWISRVVSWSNCVWTPNKGVCLDDFPVGFWAAVAGCSCWFPRA